MRINLSDPTVYEAAEWAGTLAQAQDAAELIAFDPERRCPNCNNVLNLDIWEFGDGTGQMMEACDCGFVRFDANRIAVAHEVQGLLG